MTGDAGEPLVAPARGPRSPSLLDAVASVSNVPALADDAEAAARERGQAVTTTT